MKICLIDSEINLSSGQIKKLEEHVIIQKCNILSDLQHKNNSGVELILLHQNLPSEKLRKFTSCRYIGIRSSHLDYIDQSLARSMEITVSGIPPIGEIAVAEHVFALMFAVAKQFKLSQLNIANNKWREGMSSNIELSGKTLGIIGFGRVGKQVAKMAEAFGMNVIVANKPNENDEEKFKLEYVLSESDVASLHLPNTLENQDYINSERISKLKKNSILINTARGNILDYDALNIAIQERGIVGAGLDVYPNEPSEVHPLFNHPNVVCSPHIAYFTKETIERMNEALTNNAVNYIKRNK